MVAHRSSDGLVNRLPMASGAAAGVAAYVIGYVLTYVLVEADGDLDPEQPFEHVGMLFYNAHFVSTEETVSAAGGSATSTENVLRNASTQLPEVAYFAVPIVVLAVAGFALVRVGSTLATPGDGAIGGAVLAVGVLPFSILGVFVFETSGSFMGIDGSAAPELVPAVLLVGIVYPMIFGGLGGALAGLVE